MIGFWTDYVKNTAFYDFIGALNSIILSIIGRYIL
jgi:hypothetical protein